MTQGETNNSAERECVCVRSVGAVCSVSWRLLCADMLVACVRDLSLSLQGWQHVGDRLISATVEYEETGWYDGQVGVLDPVCLLWWTA